METIPDAAELIDAAIESLRAELLPALGGREAFQVRVILNVLEIARREILQSPAADADEFVRLRGLLAARDRAGDLSDPSDPNDAEDAVVSATPTEAIDVHDAIDRSATLPTLSTMRRTLCESIREGRIDAATPGLTEHLWADVLARVAVDQPTYPSFLHEAATRTRD
jgi:hypothetical protein